MSFLLGTVLLAVTTAVTCAIPGVFVVLRRNSMVVDAISHAVFPGIVVGYFFTRDLDSPLLLLGAALAGLIVVLGSEYLSRSNLITGDAPQGLVFPALFSIGVIMVTLNFSNIHLDVHAVLVGDLNLAAFDQLIVGGVEVGPRYLFVMLGMLIINLVFICVNYRKLKITTFDPEFASTIGVRVRVLNTALMFLISLTITVAFHAAGAILVLALIVIPAASAHLLTRNLALMILVSVLVAFLGALVGFYLAYVADAATSAGMAVFMGVMFLVAWLWSASKGRFGAASAQG